MKNGLFRAVGLGLSVTLLALAGCTTGSPQQTSVPAPTGTSPAPQAPAAASAQPSQAKKMVFAGLGKSTVWYWNYVGDGMKEGAKKLNADALFQSPQNEDVPKQVSTFQSYVSQKVDGIAFAASDPTAFTNLVKQAGDAGIPVVTFDSDAPDSGRLLYIGASAYDGGVLAGKRMVQLLNGKGNVAVQVGSVTALNAKERIQGFMDGIKGSEIKVIATEVDKEDPATAAAKAQEVLAAHPNLDAFLGVYAYNAAAQAQAVKAAGKVGKVKIIGWDDAPDTLQFIKEGIIDSSVYDAEKGYGSVAVQVLYNIRTFGLDATLQMLGIDPKTPVKDRALMVPVLMITKDNVGEFLK